MSVPPRTGEYVDERRKREQRWLLVATDGCESRLPVVATFASSAKLDGCSGRLLFDGWRCVRGGFDSRFLGDQRPDDVFDRSVILVGRAEIVLDVVAVRDQKPLEFDRCIDAMDFFERRRDRPCRE